MRTSPSLPPQHLTMLGNQQARWWIHSSYLTLQSSLTLYGFSQPGDFIVNSWREWNLVVLRLFTFDQRWQVSENHNKFMKFYPTPLFDISFWAYDNTNTIYHFELLYNISNNVTLFSCATYSLHDLIKSLWRISKHNDIAKFVTDIRTGDELPQAKNSFYCTWKSSLELPPSIPIALMGGITHFGSDGLHTTEFEARNSINRLK